MKAELPIPSGAHALISRIGGTPLVELRLGHRGASTTRIFAKLESVNPGGSVKDRPVARMLLDAIAAGRFADGRRLLDSSSGNAGISYAMLGAALNIPVTVVVPGNASRERLDRIAAHGAELVLTDPLEGYDFALREAHRLASAQPERYWYCDQYSNANNWRAHYDTTGAEILAQITEQTGGPPEAFVAGVGTGGTLTGAGRRLREACREVHIAAVVPETFPGIEGLKPLGHPGDIVPAILDESLIDERIPAALDEAIAVCRELTREGLFVGPSSGAFVHGALKLAKTGRFRTIVTVLSDTGERYTSSAMWQRPRPSDPG